MTSRRHKDGDRRDDAVTLSNRGDEWCLAGRLDDAAVDLARALGAFEEIGDRWWAARTRVSIGKVCRVRRKWLAAGQYLDAALERYGAISDRPAEALALRCRWYPV